MNRKLFASFSGKPLVIVITGSTATGKTALAVEIALRFDAEVVNADARYFYRGFDIGVAKPTIFQRKRVPHHLIDILEPQEVMSIARYQDAAFESINNIASRGSLPLLVGGSPQYINAVVEGWHIPRVPPDPAFRRRMELELASSGVEALSESLRNVDPVSADRCGLNARRIIRSLEVYAATGRPMSEQQRKGPPPYDTLELELTMPREALYERIDARIDQQIENGLVDEVKQLLAIGIAADSPAFEAIGYRQLVPYLSGEIELDEAVASIRKATRRYVRHQQTWFRKNPNLTSIDVLEPDWHEHVSEAIDRFLSDQVRA